MFSTTVFYLSIRLLLVASACEINLIVSRNSIFMFIFLSYSRFFANLHLIVIPSYCAVYVSNNFEAFIQLSGFIYGTDGRTDGRGATLYRPDTSVGNTPARSPSDAQPLCTSLRVNS